MAAMNAAAPQIIEAAGIKAELRRAGRGAPLLVIHGEFGVPGWHDGLARLAEHYDVIVPSLPGYGQSTRPDWIMGVHDLAAWVTWFARDIDVRTPVNVVGCSLGGWIAAEIATVAPQFINKLVLVGAMGIKPDEGEIFDYFLDSGMTGLRRAFYRPDESAEFMRYWGKEWTPEEADLVEQHREMTCRIAWKPYMHSLTLRRLLQGVDTPTLLVWGRDDAITPLSSGEIYERAIPRARLVAVPNCGHVPEMEKPAEFAELVRSFLRD
jgi:pimeloyl-ACP methyl ester carboxylesterase